MIRESEAAKTRIYEVAGNVDLQNHNYEYAVKGDYAHALLVDEKYKQVASHVDEITRERIVKGEYVEFSKLLPTDRILQQEDNRYVPIMEKGETYWLPASEVNRKNELNDIISYFKWEQAFRVFSDIYLDKHPSRASELIQYGFVIHNASMTYTWSNVYRYDKEFRLHMSRNPERNWGVTLQQAWNMYVKDRIVIRGESSNKSPQNLLEAKKQKKICFGYNSGRCQYGNKCKFEHKCGMCGKYGHGTHNCRRAGIGSKQSENARGTQGNHYDDGYYQSTVKQERRY